MAEEPVATVVQSRVTVSAESIAPTTAPTIVPPTATALPTPTPTPFVIINPSEPCGILLPLTLPAQSATSDAIDFDELPDNIPELALPALMELLADPGHVGLAAYRVGDEANGVFLNADTPMPLASAVKLIHAIAYVRAVENGELDPTTVIPVADLDAFYLPGSDLNSHRLALQELAADGKLVEDGTGVLLRDIPWMMMRYSSNAATDYLHVLLGQERIEQTIIDLELTPHSAPCPFIGRFLLMGNHTRTISDRTALEELIAEPERYAQDVALLTDTFSQDAAFRSAETRWGRPNPNTRTQEMYTAAWDTRSTARVYANLMARIAAGDLGSPYGNALLRSYLDWPLEAFPRNQELFSAIGFKGGTLPGVLTTVYYGYPWGSAEPIVVALFYNDLPLRTYQQWRRSLPHDELAHWLLRDPEAIPTLRTLLDQSP
ncbi:MAG: class A beta-lactamase-related serine hydrolase [Anaerolineae bacterium]|nr:class A beta-lactamase-related serine hydrolase [Anaerolineae bacterium]